MGQELTLNANIDEQRDERLTQVEARLGELDVYLRRLSGVFAPLLEEEDATEEPHG